MKKIMIIDGGPRKTMSTAQMVEAFARGIRSVSSDIEVKHVRLYDIDYKGCHSCLACKVKGSKFHDVCAIKDGIIDTLRETVYADGICFASPIYYGGVTAQMQAFMERLTYPWLDYNTYGSHAPKRMPTACIYTMNAAADQQQYVDPGIDMFENVLARLLTKPERIKAMYTMQVKNYDRYDLASFPKEKKEAWRDAHWATDLQNAFDAGRRMAGQALAAQ